MVNQETMDSLVNKDPLGRQVVKDLGVNKVILGMDRTVIKEKRASVAPKGFQDQRVSEVITINDAFFLRVLSLTKYDASERHLWT